MRKWNWRVEHRVPAAVTIAIIACTMIASQQGFGQYLLRNSVLAGGQGVSSATSNVLSSTLGQPFAGSMTGGGTPGYCNVLGFWYVRQSVVTGLNAGSAVPTEFRLEQNYPNPFNPKTVVRGQWPVISDVRLVVYDLLGREVAMLADGRYPAGRYTFTFDGSSLSSGVYFYRLTAGSNTAVRKMTLMK